MNKKYIIRKNEEIQKLLKVSKKIVNKYFVVYYSKNSLGYSRFCISVSKKIGKANVRNLYRRRIKDILMKNNVDINFDYVIILRKSILDVDYLVIKKELLNVLKGDK